MTLKLSYPLPTVPEAWLSEARGESVVHDEDADGIKPTRRAWAGRRPRPVHIARNLAVRWFELELELEREFAEPRSRAGR